VADHLVARLAAQHVAGLDVRTAGSRTFMEICDVMAWRAAGCSRGSRGPTRSARELDVTLRERTESAIHEVKRHRVRRQMIVRTKMSRQRDEGQAARATSKNECVAHAPRGC
jgi:hypothetical protein